MNRIERAARRPDFLTFDETAQLLRTSKPTLRKWIQRGLVPGKKVGRKWLIPRDLLEIALDAKRGDSVKFGATE
ncbi:MAG: helix-turn-helix domain-containing protein [Thermoguttaceae bacterium]|nr:helix-turn-helix domain-containing protein [Thermoguttaceae bacterium]MBQ8286407.1 helix-turn-helix domain-containing protein [Thermoguttaceae bacterium]MBQ9800529.1 helix-turn-helix domain-containing protein [Thermoguttaceae bacterium]MBR4833043.1 helix-turn-helix domain-containing protein [Thermoguttaceae bacterium]